MKVHLAGEQNGKFGHKHQEMSSVTNALINFSICSIKKHEPMVITIKSKYESLHPFDDVKRAKIMIEKSLLEFIEDVNSEGRLLYELATYAKGTYNIRKVASAVQQYCHISHRLLWMKLLELPLSEWKGKRTPHGRYLLSSLTQQWLKGSTNCSVEVFGFGESIPALCGPYVIVCGNDVDAVNEVSDRVVGEIDKHMRGCPAGCRFLFSLMKTGGKGR